MFRVVTPSCLPSAQVICVPWACNRKGAGCPAVVSGALPVFVYPDMLGLGARPARIVLGVSSFVLHQSVTPRLGQSHRVHKREK